VKLFLVFHWQDSTDCLSRLGKLNLNNELAQPECRGRTSGEELPQIDCLNRKEKIVDGDSLEYGCQEKVVWKKNGSSVEASSSTSEKDMVQAKTKTQMVQSRQTQSGPLTPGAVLSHSLSERVRISERFVMIHRLHETKYLLLFLYLLHALVIGMCFWWFGYVTDG
jgi:hypothetical protein